MEGRGEKPRLAGMAGRRGTRTRQKNKAERQDGGKIWGSEVEGQDKKARQGNKTEK
jgi:hypothetical protein